MSDDINPNSSNYMFGKVLTKLESIEEAAANNHTEFMDRFEKHEEVDDARHKSNTERLDTLEDSKKKVIYGFGGITFVGAILHFLIDLIHPHGK